MYSRVTLPRNIMSNSLSKNYTYILSVNSGNLNFFFCLILYSTKKGTRIILNLKIILR